MKYSIIIPHYNRPDLIVQTIKSFENLKDKEIIIVDDVSTQENIKKLKQNITQIPLDQNIKFYESNEKLFLAGARNKGVELSKGQWIFFIDDDDQATPKFIKFLNKNRLNSKMNFYRFPNIERINGKNKMLIFKWWHKKYSPQVSTYLFNKEFLIKNNLFFNPKIKFGEDIYFEMELFEIKKIKSKYIHCFSFYYNTYENVDSMVRSINQFPETHLQFIDQTLNTNYKTSKSTCLQFLAIYYLFLWRKGKYADKFESLKIFSNYYQKISPKLSDFWKININWKISIIMLKFSIKKYKKKLNNL